MKKARNKTEVERLRFAQMLDELKADGITQTDFARAIGFTQQYVSSVKKGIVAPSISMAKEIEMAFPKYRAAWLLGLDDRIVSKVDALKVLDTRVLAMSTERRDALLEYVQDFIDFRISREIG